ncbi:MAG TPA: glycosyltransferase [Chitinophagaceae bacterium]|nr:glycosyltransferase [Chitinophagaceae bacterium]
MLLLYIILSLFILYSIVVLRYWYHWKNIPLYKPASSPSTTISVIIPARNEEENIGALLKALEQQTYPSSFFEVIVIDDHSTDNTAAIVKQFPHVRILQNADATNSFKKKAVETGIGAAINTLIVVTDADCIPPPTWLQTIAAFKEEKQSVFIAAPVVINCNPSTVQMFQAMDFMILQGITGAVVQKQQLSMCNGANLAYEKKAFEAVNGFAGIDTIASGDDMLLMYKIWKKFPGQVHYLKSEDAIVSTQPMQTWKEFFRQRIRWASKANKYEDKRFFPILLLVYLFNLSFLSLIIGGFFNYQYWILLGIAWVAKTLVELPLFASVAKFFHKQWALKLFFFFQPLHIIYTIISGLFGQFGKYEWKGRTVK